MNSLAKGAWAIGVECCVAKLCMFMCPAMWHYGASCVLLLMLCVVWCVGVGVGVGVGVCVGGGGRRRRRGRG
eukprot:4398188-Alexandrium_andersonii.AAC.1